VKGNKPNQRHGKYFRGKICMQAETAKVRSVYFRENNTWDVPLRQAMMDINKTTML